MITPELVSYIKDALGKGYSKDAIKQSLVSGGWHDADLEEAFQTIAPQNPIPARPMSPASFRDVGVEKSKKRLYYWLFGLLGLAAIIFVIFLFMRKTDTLSSVDPELNNNQVETIPIVPTEDTSLENGTDTNSPAPVSGYPEKYTNTNIGFTFNYKKAYTAILEINPPPQNTTAARMAMVLLDTQPFSSSNAADVSNERILNSHTFSVAKNDSNDSLTAALPGESVLVRQFQSGNYSCKEYVVTDIKKYAATVCKSGVNSFGYLHPQTSSPLVDISSVILN